MSISPDGRYAAVRVNHPAIATNRLELSWHIVAIDGSEPAHQVPDAGEPIFTSTGEITENEDPKWSNDSQWIFYRARQGQEVQIWRTRIDGTVREQLTHDEADIQQFALNPDQTHLAYVVGSSRQAILDAEAREARDGVLLGNDTYGWLPLVQTAPRVGRWTTIRRYTAFSDGTLLFPEPIKTKLLEMATGLVRDAKPDEFEAVKDWLSSRPRWAKPSWRYPHQSLDGQRVAYFESEPSEIEHAAVTGIPFNALFVAASENPNQPQQCTDPACRGISAAVVGWSSDGSEVLFVTEPGNGQASLYAWNVSGMKVRLVRRTDGMLGARAGAERTRGAGCLLSGEAAICITASATGPPQIEAVSLNDGHSRVVFDPNVELRAVKKSRVEFISWTNRLKFQSHGTLVYPSDFHPGKRYPLVITTYWCRGFLTGGSADGAPEYVLAEQDFFALCLDVSLFYLPTLGQHIPSTLVPERYPRGLEELESAVELLVQRGFIDRSRVGVTGVSFGGNLVSYALSHSTAFAAAAIRHAGVWEPEYQMFLPIGSPIGDFQRRAYNVNPGNVRGNEAWAEVSASLRASKVDAAVLIQANDQEYLSALPVYAALRGLNKPVEMYVFPAETHQLHQPVHRLVNFERTVDWFRFWLQGIEDKCPVKKPQYERWRKMKVERDKSIDQRSVSR